MLANELGGLRLCKALNRDLPQQALCLQQRGHIPQVVPRDISACHDDGDCVPVRPKDEAVEQPEALLVHPLDIVDQNNKLLTLRILQKGLQHRFRKALILCCVNQRIGLIDLHWHHRRGVDVYGAAIFLYLREDVVPWLEVQRRFRLNALVEHQKAPLIAEAALKPSQDRGFPDARLTRQQHRRCAALCHEFPQLQDLGFSAVEEGVLVFRVCLHIVDGAEDLHLVHQLCQLFIRRNAKLLLQGRFKLLIKAFRLRISPHANEAPDDVHVDGLIVDSLVKQAVAALQQSLAVVSGRKEHDALFHRRLVAAQKPFADLRRPVLKLKAVFYIKELEELSGMDIRQSLRGQLVIIHG